MPRLSLPHWRLPAWRLPAWHLPAWHLPKWRLPQVTGIVLGVAAVLAVLLIVPLAYSLRQSAHPVAVRQNAVGHLPSTSGTSAATPQAAAIPGVEAKTGLRFGAKCSANAACLSVVGQSLGTDAAAVIFSTAGSGGRQCAGYVFRREGSWHLLDAACGLPDQLSPLVGHDATVHVPGSCANVHDAASLNARVVGCVYDGAAVHIDAGPTFADGRLWWHEKLGWLAHDFLIAP
jgi:hypothetical protein